MAHHITGSKTVKIRINSGFAWIKFILHQYTLIYFYISLKIYVDLMFCHSISPIYFTLNYSTWSFKGQESAICLLLLGYFKSVWITPSKTVNLYVNVSTSFPTNQNISAGTSMKMKPIFQKIISKCWTVTCCVSKMDRKRFCFQL